MPNPTGTKWLSLTQLATAWNKTPQALGHRVKVAGFPSKMVGKRRVFPWPDVADWWADYRAEQAKESAKPADFEDARARKMMADAAIAEDELRVRRGKLVPAERYERELGRAYGRVRSRLLSLPPRAAPDLMGLTDEAKIEAILDRYVLEVIEELRTEDVPDDEPDDLEAAA